MTDCFESKSGHSTWEEAVVGESEITFGEWGGRTLVGLRLRYKGIRFGGEKGPRDVRYVSIEEFDGQCRC